jgi:hypothetical protein
MGIAGLGVGAAVVFAVMPSSKNAEPRAPGTVPTHSTPGAGSSAPSAVSPPSIGQGEFYLQRSKEASLNLRKLFDSSVSYYNEEHADRTGRVIPRQFPSGATRTPARAAPCVDGKPVALTPTDATFAASTWQALNFAVDEPHFYQYEYESAGTGTSSTFIARAIADLDCDGIEAVFERHGRVDGNNNVNGGDGLKKPREGVW